MQKEIKSLFVLATRLVYILILKGKDKNDGKKICESIPILKSTRSQASTYLNEPLQMRNNKRWRVTAFSIPSYVWRECDENRCDVIHREETDNDVTTFSMDTK